MIKLPLEELLDKGFEALGVKTRRTFREETLAGADIDDEFGIISREEYFKQRKAAKKVTKRAILCLLLSEAQNASIGNDYIPDLRKSWKYNDFQIQFNLNFTETLDCYEASSDKLIEAGKIRSYDIGIFDLVYEYILYSIEVQCTNEYDFHPANTINVYTFANEKELEKIKPKIRNFDSKVKGLMNLKGKEADPNKIYEAVMRFVM